MLKGQIYCTHRYLGDEGASRSVPSRAWECFRHKLIFSEKHEYLVVERFQVQTSFNCIDHRLDFIGVVLAGFTGCMGALSPSQKEWKTARAVLLSSCSGVHEGYLRSISPYSCKSVQPKTKTVLISIMTRSGHLLSIHDSTKMKNALQILTAKQSIIISILNDLSESEPSLYPFL